MLKRLIVSTALTGAMIGMAAAQGAPPATSAPSAPSAASSAPASGAPQAVGAQKPDQWLATKFTGTDVIGTDDKKIGDVSDILFDHNGKIEAYVVSVGGFLGVGSKEVALAPSSFTVVKGENGGYDKLKLSMSADQLKSAANFERYSPPRATTGAATPGSSPARAPSSTNR
ncbi:MAG TPA: PRC-barrel domain-containing protein [Pseudorhodoplanes sp.]|jgi:hypothetical protein|nr:PRC-barrel domain-containing protein [Pseudorhodoplanes sp.]